MKRIKIKLPWFFEAEWGTTEVDETDQGIAWELYCELGTRVGVVEFNPEEDAIINCLQSWYSFFKLARESLKRLKPPKEPSFLERILPLKEKSDEKLSGIIIRMLNDQFRPFLRHWFPEFEFFWEHESDKTLIPIERQKAFSKYQILIQEVNELQTNLKFTSEALFTIATS